VLGMFLGVLVSRGRALGALRAVLAVTAGAGAVALAAAAVALTVSQPGFVWYPLALVGTLALGGGLLAGILVRRRVAALELRKMAAQDVGS